MEGSMRCPYMGIPYMEGGVLLYMIKVSLHTRANLLCPALTMSTTLKSTFNRDACGQYHWLCTDGRIVTVWYNEQLCLLECENPDGSLFVIPDVMPALIMRALLFYALPPTLHKRVEIVNPRVEKGIKIPAWIKMAGVHVRMIQQYAGGDVAPRNPFFKQVFGDVVLFMPYRFAECDARPRFSSLHLVNGHNYCYE